MYFSQRTQAACGTGIVILAEVYLSLNKRPFLHQFPELPLPVVYDAVAGSCGTTPSCIAGSTHRPLSHKKKLHTMFHEKKIIFYGVNLKKRRHRCMDFPLTLFLTLKLWRSILLDFPHPIICIWGTLEQICWVRFDQIVLRRYHYDQMFFKETLMQFLNTWGFIQTLVEKQHFIKENVFANILRKPLIFSKKNKGMRQKYQCICCRYSTACNYKKIPHPSHFPVLALFPHDFLMKRLPIHLARDKIPIILFHHLYCYIS